MPRKKKQTKKLSLSELMAGGESNAKDLQHKEPEKQKYRERYRTPRHRLIPLKGGQYNRPLANDPARDMKYNELAREFVMNGLDGAKAYAAVFGVPVEQAYTSATNIFNSSWMRAKINEYLLGQDGEFTEELDREYIVRQLLYMIDNNILDYIADDGTYLSVKELKRLPEWAQKQIRKLSVHTTTTPVAIKDDQGQVIRDEEGEIQYAEVREQHVHIELYDKQKAIDHLAKVMRWIQNTVDVNLNLITSDTMLKAESRVKKLRRDDIEGKAERITSD
jgi:hypothetical protein